MKGFRYVLVFGMLLLILLLFRSPFAAAMLPAASAGCIIPSDNMEIQQNVLFCEGAFNIESGIKILNDNLLIECNSTALIGRGIGYGFLLKDRNGITIKNCNVSNYEIGIYLENTNDSAINYNSLTKNKFGISLLNSYNNNADNNFMSENAKDDFTNNIVLGTIEEVKPFIIEKKNAANQKDFNASPIIETKISEDGSKKKTKIDYLLIVIVAVIIVLALYFVYNWIFYRKN